MSDGSVSRIFLQQSSDEEALAGETSSGRTKKFRPTFAAYAVQCAICFKWRLIPTMNEFEEIRSKIVEEPFVCNKRPNKTCDDPADINYCSSRTWLIEKPSIPKTPAGFSRELLCRKNFSKMDVHYITPEGFELSSSTDVAEYLEQYPGYKESVSEADFSFEAPEAMNPEHLQKMNSDVRFGGRV